ASLSLLGAAVASRAQTQKPGEPPAGAPPAFNTSPPVGPEVSSSTFAEAEKLVNVELTAPDRTMAADSWRTSMAPLYERRIGPRKINLEPTVAPWSRWDSALPGEKAGPSRDQFIRSKTEPGALPAREEDIAFASLTQLSRWVEKRQLSSERL